MSAIETMDLAAIDAQLVQICNLADTFGTHRYGRKGANARSLSKKIVCADKLQVARVVHGPWGDARSIIS